MNEFETAVEELNRIFRERDGETDLDWEPFDIVGNYLLYDSSIDIPLDKKEDESYVEALKRIFNEYIDNLVERKF